MSVFLPVQKSCMPQMFPVERCQTWNDSAGNQRHCTSENAKCNKSPSFSSEFLWLLCPARSFPNCRILKIGHRITGDPLSWEPSAGLGHGRDIQLRKSGSSAQHSHKISDHPRKGKPFMKYQPSLINRSSILSFAELLGYVGNTSLASWWRNWLWVSFGYLHLPYCTASWGHLGTSDQNDVQKPLGWRIGEL